MHAAGAAERLDVIMGGDIYRMGRIYELTTLYYSKEQLEAVKEKVKEKVFSFLFCL